MRILLVAFLFTLGCDDRYEDDRKMMEVKTQACMNACPRGVAKMEHNYGTGFKCECR